MRTFTSEAATNTASANHDAFGVPHQQQRVPQRIGTAQNDGCANADQHVRQRQQDAIAADPAPAPRDRDEVEWKDQAATHHITVDAKVSIVRSRPAPASVPRHLRP